MRIFHVVLFLLCMATAGFTQSNAGQNPIRKIGANYRIYPSSIDQSEVFIAKSPVDQNILFAACNTLNFSPFFVSEGIYTTTNGGSSWLGNDTCTGTPIAYHGGDPGVAIDKNGTFILTRMGRSPFVGLYSHYSTDNGKTWSAQKVVSTDDLERAALTSDVNPANTFYGRTYAVWVKFAQPFPLMFAYSDDGAKYWSTPKAVNNPAKRSAGGDVAVGPGGKVYACWAGVLDVTPFNEILTGFAVSSNGGTTWNVTENAFSTNGINGVLINKKLIRVNGLPAIAVDTTNGARRGWIYIVSGQKNLAPAGSDPDIILHRSTDGGLTWSAGIRVNQDPLNNGKTQFFPSIHIDRFGALNIIFYDDRRTTIDSSGVFLARSVDGGDTWTEFEISDHNFQPEPIGGLAQGYQGDNIDITSTDSRLIPVWMDNSSGKYQIWSVPIVFSDVNGVGEVRSSASVSLKQNYPNPFRTSTNIEFHVAVAGHVSLKVFDILGSEVADLVHETKSPGNYTVEFSPLAVMNDHTLTSGIYIVQIKLNDRVETIRMTFIQ
jgi:hypothetical protein